MKKILLILFGLAILCSTYAQNEYKYVIYAYGGHRVGSEDRIASMAPIDSILVVGNMLTIYSGSTPYYAMSGAAVLADGSEALTADWDVGAYSITGLRFVSDVATGTAPFTVASTTVVSNLNSDLLDGQEGSYYMDNATHTGEVTGSGALTIADDIIEAANLEATNSPTDNYLPSYDAASGGFTWVESSGGGTTTMTDMDGTAWRIFYSNGSGDVTELAFGADGTVLTSGGPSAAPAFESVSGTGDMLSTNNLSDVASAATSRTNLDVYSQAEVASLVSDSLDALLAAGEAAVALADSSGVAVGSYVTGWDFSQLSLSSLGVTATSTEVNIMDGVTSTTAELNTLDGVTSTASELNILDGATLSTTELNYVDGVTSSIQTQLDSKQSANYTAINAETGTSYTFVLADDDEYTTFTNASAITVTIPPNSSVAFPIGATIDCEQAGAGTVTFQTTDGVVTLNAFDSDTVSAGQHAVFTLIKTATNEWTLTGNL